METGGAPLYTTKSSEPSESLAFCRAKAVSSFLSIGPIPGFKTHDLQALKSCKRSTDWARQPRFNSGFKHCIYKKWNFLQVTSLLGVLFLTLAFHHLSVSADEEEVGIQLRDVRYMKFQWPNLFPLLILATGRKRLFSDLDIKDLSSEDLQSSFFRCLVLLSSTCIKQGCFWAFYFVIDYAVVLPLQLQQVTLQIKLTAIPRVRFNHFLPLP